MTLFISDILGFREKPKLECVLNARVHILINRGVGKMSRKERFGKFVQIVLITKFQHQARLSA